MVYVFKQPFLIFKQYFTYFNIFFYPHVFLQMFLNNNFQFLNTYTKQTLIVRFFFFFLMFLRYLMCFNFDLGPKAVILKKIQFSSIWAQMSLNWMVGSWTIYSQVWVYHGQTSSKLGKILVLIKIGVWGYLWVYLTISQPDWDLGH